MINVIVKIIAEVFLFGLLLFFVFGIIDIKEKLDKLEEKLETLIGKGA